MHCAEGEIFPILGRKQSFCIDQKLGSFKKLDLETTFFETDHPPAAGFLPEGPDSKEPFIGRNDSGE